LGHLIFTVAGTGALRERLEKLASELNVGGRVTFLGYVPEDELAALYCAADCFVLAAAAELQSIATMEAMASGLPVLAADAVALAELVHNGANGYLFEPGNVGMVAGHLTSVFTDSALRRAMGGESLRLIQNHAITRTMEEFERSYAEAIRRREATGAHCAPNLRRTSAAPFIR
jgi:glycosyltransferase involved in cell wall biosynthesis